jgi:hypothetical protein
VGERVVDGQPEVGPELLEQLDGVALELPGRREDDRAERHALERDGRHEDLAGGLPGEEQSMTRSGCRS